MRQVLGVTAGIALAELVDAPDAEAQLGSPPLVTPPEIRYRANEKRLRGVMELYRDKLNIPNVGNDKPLRAFRGWDPATPAPPRRTNVGPGPTLRARVGDKVQISFFNKVDDTMFAYTFDTNSKPGLSSFGCDVTGNASL